MKLPVTGLVILSMIGIAAAEHQENRFRPSRQSEYFFLPPRTLFHFRPDYYVFGAYFPRDFYRWPPPRRKWSHSPPFAQGPGFIGAHAPGAYRLVLDTSGSGQVVRANFGDVVFEVDPPRALVYVDGKLIGSARDFASDRHSYTLIQGEHDLRIEYPGYAPFEARLEVTPNRTLRLDIRLEPEP